MSEIDWPQLEVDLHDHARSMLPDKAGTYFKSEGTLQNTVRNELLNLRLGDVKKAGTESHQRAAAATAWLLCNVQTNFASIDMAWTGLSSV